MDNKEVDSLEFDFEFIRGQRHYHAGGKKEDLKAPPARAGWEAEKFWHKKKVNKAEFN